MGSVEGLNVGSAVGVLDGFKLEGFAVGAILGMRDGV